MKNIKRYGMGGAVQSFSSPMLAEGMQSGLSGFGTSGVPAFAKGGRVNIVKRNEGNYYYRRTEGAIGAFQWKSDYRYPEGTLFPLDDFDYTYTIGVKLKKGEVLFRYETDIMMGRMRPLIKLNLDKALIYFGIDTDDNEPKFESRGVKAEYIVLEEGNDKKYAKGGKVNDEHYIVRIYTNGKVGKDAMFSNVEPKSFPDINDAMRFAHSLMDENFSEIDKIKIFTSEGRLVQEYNNRDSDKNVKENYLYKQKIPNNYQGKTAEQIWNLLTPYQRSHYLDDHENGDYADLIHEDWDNLNDRVRIGFELHTNRGQYAKGGKTANYKVGDLVLLKYDIRYGREDSIPHKIVDIDDKMLIIEDASKFRSKRRVPRAKVDPSTIIPFENYEKERLSIINAYADGGTIEGRNTSTGEKFAVVIGSQKKADEYIENGTQVNVRKSYSSRISEMKLIFDSKGNLYEEIDYGYALDGYPNTSSGNGYKHGFGKEGLEEKATLRVLSRMYSPSFAKKLIESVKSKNYGEGGKADIYIENKGVKFDKKKYKGILSDFDGDGLPNVDDPDPFGKQDKNSIEQVKFSNTFNKVIDTKKSLDLELKKFVTKLQNSTSGNEKIYARTKTPFSILNKLVDSRLLDEKRGLKDLVGTTITFKDVKTLEKYMRKVRRGDLGKVLDYDDYYTNPNDGYRAYHFIVEQDGIPIELQLKTDRMKEVNILSHDAYKNKTLNKDYMLYLTNLASEADKGNKISGEQFSELMADKGQVRKRLSTKN